MICLVSATLHPPDYLFVAQYDQAIANQEAVIQWLWKFCKGAAFLQPGP